jgi:hypothetical protein
MNYEQFRATWYEALAEVGMSSFLAPPTETLDGSASLTAGLGAMSRTYQVYAYLEASRALDPFHVSARLRWTWDALQAARTETTEVVALMLLETRVAARIRSGPGCEWMSS